MRPADPNAPRQTIKWVLLMVAPMAALVVVALLQLLIHDLLLGGEKVGGQPSPLLLLTNIVSVVAGIVGVASLFLLPLWIVKLVRDRRYNLEHGYGLDKRTVVTLAVIFGFWAWLYTYDKDDLKFWVNAGLSLISFGYWSPIAWLWVVIATANRPPEFYQDYTPDPKPQPPISPTNIPPQNPSSLNLPKPRQ